MKLCMGINIFSITETLEFKPYEHRHCILIPRACSGPVADLGENLCGGGGEGGGEATN
jgi:hypothetical protein